VGAMTEMYVQGVSTRKVKAITEELCGHEVSASTISRLNVKLDEKLERFAHHRLSEPYPYLILDARYEKVREDGVITSQAVMIAIGVDWEGGRNVLAVELANRESQSSWREFCLALEERGQHGVEFGHQRRPRGPAEGNCRGVHRSGMATLLRAFPAERAGLPATEGRQRLSDRTVGASIGAALKRRDRI